MAIFGYLGEFRGPGSLDALCAYGQGLAGDPYQSAPSAYSSPHRALACWGPEVASEESVTVVLSGRPELSIRPPRIASRPAEAILAGYRERGMRILTELSGPFAIGILDHASQRAILAVDHIGIERLTYCAEPRGIVFGTSASAVACSPEVGTVVDRQALFEYLFHHMIPAPRTIYRRVEKLRAGYCVLYENGAVNVQRYWKPRFESRGDGSFAALKTELHEAVHDAVRHCLTEGESVGAFLSGGLDSSTVAGVLNTVAPRPAQTFSIGFGHPEYDERAYARITNAHFGCKGHEFVVDGSHIAAAFPLIARAYDEPFGNSSALPTYYCARLAKERGVTHLLAGDGGDELFAGNSRYTEQRVFERYCLLPKWLRRSVLEPILLDQRAPASLPLVRKAGNYIRQSNVPLPDRLENWNPLVRLGLGEVLSTDFLAVIDRRSVFEHMREVWSSAPSDDYLHRMLYYDWQFTLADNDLRKVGTMCALAGIRVSYPMLDSGVVEMSTHVPSRLMMRRGKLRYFYKRAMRGFLPDAVIEKKKHGFGLPFGLWLKDSAALRELTYDNLSNLRNRRLFRTEFLEQLLRLHQDEDSRYYGVFVWVLAMLEQWLREHQVGF